MTILALRPQPIGIFPLPAGYLLLPPVEGAADVQQALLAGELPAVWPEPLRFYALALNGQSEAALAVLAGETTPEARYNQFVLGGDPVLYEVLRGELSGELAVLLEVVAYALGLADTVPAPGATTGELRACVLSAHAAAALEYGDGAAAFAALNEASEAAAVSPLLAAQILGDLADVEHTSEQLAAQALLHYREALDLLSAPSLAPARGQIALKLAIAYHERARGQREVLQEAARCYQDALQSLTREGQPEAYALAQNNLALAYLAMPLVEASDQLRASIAVSALREALRVYTREAYPEQWASAQINLANALQYMPSTHLGDNLVEAVELYEDVLQTRDSARDPIGYARLLANQGNALAHLGIFDHSRAKLNEAVQVFQRAGDTEAAAAVADVLAGLEQTAAARQEKEAHAAS